MMFQYKCWDCEEVIEKEFPIGKADEKVPCPKCKKEVERFWGEVSFVLKGDGWAGKNIAFNREMTQRNEDAGKRMEKTWRGSEPKLIDQR